VTLDLPIEAFQSRAPTCRTCGRRSTSTAGWRESRCESEFDELVVEFIDRFGAYPPEVERLLLLSANAIWAHSWKIAAIHLEEGFIVFDYTDRKPKSNQLCRSQPQAVAGR